MDKQKTKHLSWFLICVGLMPWAISCANHDLPQAVVIDCTGYQTVSYLQHIKPIVDDICSDCHNSSFPGRNWTIPEELKAFADEAARRVTLPVSNPDHMPKDGRVLSEEQMKNIYCWAEQGAPI